LGSENRQFLNPPISKLRRPRQWRGLFLFGGWVSGDTSDNDKIQFLAFFMKFIYEN